MMSSAEDREVVLLEQLIFGGKPNNKRSVQLRRDYLEKEVPPKSLNKEEQFLADFDPSKYSQEPTTKRVKIGSKQHISQLKNTIAHLEQLKSVFKAGSANRMVVSQACAKLKHLLRKLQPQTPESGAP